MNKSSSSLELVERYTIAGREVAVRREDLRVGAPFVPHGKTASIIALMRSLALERRTSVSCFASRGSDWALNAAIAAQDHGLDFTIYAGKTAEGTALPDFLFRALNKFGARVELLRNNHSSIMISQAKKMAASRASFFIPFGLELSAVVDELTIRLRGFACAATVVVCAGSGVTLACLLRAALLDERKFKRVVAVSSGRSEKQIVKTLQRYATDGATAELEIVEGATYGGNDEIESVWPTHPFYERKAYRWLVENIAQLEQPIAFLNM